MRHHPRARRLRLTALVVLIAAGLLLAGCSASTRAHRWSDAELATLRTLSLDALPPLPADPSNAVADLPLAADLGRALFFDPRLSASGTVSCATCHDPARAFTDGRPLAVGEAQFTRNSMSLVGSAWSPWQTWDGKADSQWMQALLPLENPAEHGLTRTAVVLLVAEHHAAAFEAVFGPLPALADDARFPAHAGPVGDDSARAAWGSMRSEDRETINRLFAGVGKALAAFDRTLAPEPTRFDSYVAAATAGDRSTMATTFTPDEAAGLRLFIGRARCVECHNGPLLTNFEFHNTAVPPVIGQPLDRGRSAALEALTASEFNCLGPWSDAPPEGCSQLRFLASGSETLTGAFRTPTLRNLGLTAPYMHGGQMATLADVLEHYNGGGLQLLGHNELTPLGLTAPDLGQLEAFLGTLDPATAID